MRRFLFATVVAALLAGAAGLFVWSPRGGSAADVPYRLGDASTAAPITASVRATGTLNPVTTVLVGSQLSGQVVEILADYNSQVKEGQVVARLDADPDPGPARRRPRRRRAGARRSRHAQAGIDRIRATRVRAEATLRDLAAQRERVAAQLADARRTLDRQTELIAAQHRLADGVRHGAARNRGPEGDARLGRGADRLAEGRARRARGRHRARRGADAKSAEAAILQKQAKLRDAEIDLARTDVKSPVDGVVVQRNIDLGQTVAASLSAPTLFTIAQDLREIEIWANIDEADVGRLKSGQPVSFSVNAYPDRTFEGRVRMVRLGAQTVQNVVTYTGVDRGPTTDDMALLPGMTANLQIVTDERPRRAARAERRAALPPAGRRRHDGGAGAGAGRSGHAVGRPARRARDRGAARAPRRRGAADAGAVGGDRARSWPRPGRASSTAIPACRTRSAAETIRQARRALMEKIGGDARSGTPRQVPGDRERSAARRQGAGRCRHAGTGLRPRRGRQPEAGRRCALGVTDGSHTELVAGELEAGAAIIVGGGPRQQHGADAGDRAGRAPARSAPVLTMALIETRDLTRIYELDAGRVVALDRVSLDDRGRRFRRRDGSLRVRQIDPDEPDRLPRPPDRRHLSARRRPRSRA